MDPEHARGLRQVPLAVGKDALNVFPFNTRERLCCWLGRLVSGGSIEPDPVGDFIPGSVATVVSAGVTVDSLRNVFGSVRLRYFGSRPLIEDNSLQSKATSLTNLEGGYKLSKNVKLLVDVFNLFDAKDSDIDYYYASRLPNEPPDGVNDIHLHPTLPRTARLNLVIGF